MVIIVKLLIQILEDEGRAQYSRAVEYSLDEVNRVATVYGNTEEVRISMVLQWVMRKDLKTEIH
jgi:hypothetical protein